MDAHVPNPPRPVSKRWRKHHAVVADARQPVAERTVGARLQVCRRLAPVRVDRREGFGQHFGKAVDVRSSRGVTHHEPLGVGGAVRTGHPELAHSHVAAPLHLADVAMPLMGTGRLRDRDQPLPVRDLLLVGVVVLRDQLADGQRKVPFEPLPLGGLTDGQAGLGGKPRKDVVAAPTAELLRKRLRPAHRPSLPAVAHHALERHALGYCKRGEKRRHHPRPVRVERLLAHVVDVAPRPSEDLRDVANAHDRPCALRRIPGQILGLRVKEGRDVAHLPDRHGVPPARHGQYSHVPVELR